MEPVARDHAVLWLRPDAALEAEHTRPGQYCQVQVPGLDDPSYFVLIDPPGTSPLRFLVRTGAGAVTDALLAATPATELYARGPLGGGFPVEQATGRDVVLASAGTGLGAVLPLVQLLPPTSARRVWIFHGARSAAHVPFRAELERARDAGAHVTLAYSQDPPGTSRQERVQDALRAQRPALGNAVAFVAGMDAMVDALREVLPTLGLPAARLYLNY